MFNFRQSKKGFTTVELVIVIVVIAVLAGVLIPTFSSVISRANLNSDMQAVRQMNQALQAYTTLGGKVETVEDAMKVIAAQGYGTNSWTCLSKNYTVYWHKGTNTCVLYNSATAEIEYPKDFNKELFVTAGEEFYAYNQFSQEAERKDLGLGIGSASSGLTDKANNGSLSSITIDESDLKNIGGTALSSFDAGSLSASGALKSGDVDANGNVKVISAKEDIVAVPGSDYQIKLSTASTVSNFDKQKQTLKSLDDLKPDVFYVSTTLDENATPEQKIAAAKEIGDYVYTVFTQINSGKVQSDITIAVQPGTEIDICSQGQDWAIPKTFSGYFGSTDEDKPLVISGLKLTENTSYTNTYTFLGSQSSYYMCGFFGAVYGTTTIENIIFKDIEIAAPAADRQLIKGEGDSNCVGIIGGIVAMKDNTEANVTLKNIKVDSSCSIKGASRVGGLIGYIGGYAIPSSEYNPDNVAVKESNKQPASKNTQYRVLHGKITIDRCEVSCDVVSNNKSVDKAGYATAGGIIGFVNKIANCELKGNTQADVESLKAKYGLTITLDKCAYNGSKIAGYIAGGLVANFDPLNGLHTLNINNCTVNKDVQIVDEANRTGAQLAMFVGRHATGSLNFDMSTALKADYAGKAIYTNGTGAVVDFTNVAGYTIENGLVK